ncbi:MAG: IclR family transcriptional regulator, regulon repressor [Gaiellales bacterium]|jgi:IclR family acetate operon transcriptional repressor|nr:IclR family transcriptional regulator, regulon repressor [Gaiellales bacterium]
MPPTGKPAERRLEAVERAMRVLDAFLDLPGEVGTNEIARRTGINASTVSRLLSTLVSGGYVQHLPETGRYRLGPHLIRLANHVMSGLDLRGLARPHLVALEQATGETATLSVAGERDAVTVDFVASRQTVASVARIGRPSVAHATATGKVMMAFGDAAALDGSLERFTDRTVTDRKVLRREIERVREQGWAQAVKEREADLNAVAAPVFGAGGTLAAILGVQGPASRFGRKKREAALPFLQDHAAAISGELGYTEHVPPVK